MRFVFLFLLLALLDTTSLSPAWSSQSILTIQRQCASIDRNLKHYRFEETGVEGYSTQGTLLRGYFWQSSIRKIEMRSSEIHGKITQTRENYYFWNRRLIFASRVESFYDKQGGKVIKRVRDRFYFAKGKLIRWVNSNAKIIPLKSHRARQVEGETLYQARDFLSWVMPLPES